MSDVERVVAVVLSGCGVYDGSEITEAVSMMVALSQAHYSVRFFAPDREQLHVVDHLKGEVMTESRHILTESARIARGKIESLSALDVSQFDALVFPGGFGAAKNLTTFVMDGTQAVLFEDVQRVVFAAIQAKKPIVALCAAPLVLGIAARELGIRGAQITLGDGKEYPDMNAALESWGQTHVLKAVDQACVDVEHRFVTAPAYMYGAANPAEIFAASQAAVAALSSLLATPTA